MTESYLSLKQAAAKAGISYAALRREIEKGRLNACRVGRKYFISATEIDDFCLQQSTLIPENSYSIRQIMEILPLSYAFIIELIKSGRLHALRSGRRYLVPADELERFLQDSRIQAASSEEDRPLKDSL